MWSQCLSSIDGGVVLGFVIASIGGEASVSVYKVKVVSLIYPEKYGLLAK